MIDVVIVGAGPVGLVCALLLDAAGVETVVVEADEGPSDDPRASTFHPPTLDMLAPFGVSEHLMAHGLVCPTWQIRMHETGERAVFDMSVLADDTDYPFRLQCEQSVLTRHLAERLANASYARLRYAEQVVGLDQDADGTRVQVSSKRGERSEIEARLVIGADGASSTVRTLLGVDFPGLTYPETTVLASTPFPFQDHIEGLSNVTYCWSEAGNFALLRLPHLWRCSLYFDPHLRFDEATQPARVQRQLRDIYPHPTRYEIIDCRPYTVHQRIVGHYRRGRVVLAGDAAHVNSPSGGMGMNGGIHDGFSLVARILDVLEGQPIERLDEYARQRRAIAHEEILGQADRNRKRMTERDPAKRRASLDALRATAEDPQRAREHLLRSSMIAGLRRAGQID